MRTRQYLRKRSKQPEKSPFTPSRRCKRKAKAASKFEPAAQKPKTKANALNGTQAKKIKNAAPAVQKITYADRLSTQFSLPKQIGRLNL